MRIISGSMRGTKLYTLEGENTRPTLDRVKEALFSKISEKLYESVVLDLFAGSGALGIESLSRGAKKAVLCDSSREAIKIINQNISKTKTEENIILYNCDFKKALQSIKDNGMKFDIVFLDPPYKTNYAVDSVKIIMDSDLLQDDGIIIIETDDKNRVIDNLDKEIINLYDIKQYGRVNLLFLNKE